MPPTVAEDKDALQSIIARFHPASASKVNSPDDLEPQIIYLIDQIQPPLKEDTRRRLQLLRTLWPITGKNPCILDYLASCSSNLYNLGDVAEQCFTFPQRWRGYYSTSDYHGYEFTDAEMAVFRAYFYDLYPARVLRGMAKSGRIPCQSEDVKVLLLDIFSAVIDEAVDITTASTRDLTARFLEKQQGKTRPLAVQAVRTFQSIQRLQAIVITLEQIGPLLTAKLHSANVIAYKDIQELKKCCPDLDPGAIPMIKDRALMIATRNEQAWLYLLKTRTNDLEPVSLEPDPSRADTSIMERSAKKEAGNKISLQTLFKEINTAGCEHCCSVLSPSAYFVDLLRLLENVKLDDGLTLQQKFFSRRGDLADLELSCANTNDLIQYIDLVHEVLQKFCVDLATSTGEITKPQSVKGADADDVYFDQDLHMQVLSKMVYPMTVFPYNLATTSIEHYLRTLDISRLAVTKIFQSRYRIFDKTDVQAEAIRAIDGWGEAKQGTERDYYVARMQKAKGLLTLAETVIQRALTAQSLGLIQEEYILLTDEAYFSRSAAKIFKGPMTTKEYLAYVKRRSTGELWGYTSDMEMLSNDEEHKTGLTFVQAALLPRSGLSFDELVELLKTQYIGCRLIIVPALAAEKFSKDSELVRLCSLPSVSEPSTDLNEQVCRDLVCFIRLYRKLNWSISELDAALSCLWRSQALQVSTDPVEVDEQQIIGSRVQQDVTPDVLESLSAITQLLKMTGLPILQLLSLWGQMDTFGPKSLYSSLFLEGGSARDFEIFGPDSQGDFFAQSHTIGDGFISIAGAMSVSRLELAELLKATELSKHMPLTIPVVSKIYRYMTLCSILKTTYPELRQLLRQPTFSRIFDGPQTTLRILSSWNGLAELGWSATDIVLVCSPAKFDSMSLSEDRNKVSATVAALCTTIVPQENASKSALNGDLLLSQEIVMAAIRSQNSGVAEPILRILISDIIRFGPEDQKILGAAQYLNQVRTAPSQMVVQQGYFIALVSGNYSFDASQGSIMIDGIPLITPDKTAEWHKDTVALRKGEAYSISFVGPGRNKPDTRNLRDLKWQCLHQAALPALATVLAAEDTVKRLQEIVALSTGTIKIVTQFDLQDEELRFFVSSNALSSSIPLQQPSIAALQKLRRYFSLRNSIRSVSKNDNRLLRFLRWCSDSTSTGDLSKQIADLTSSSLQSVVDILEHRYPGVPVTMRKRLLHDIEELDNLLSIWPFFSTTKLSLTDEPLLFDLAQPPRPDQYEDEFKLSASLRTDTKTLFDTSDKTKATAYTTVVRNVVEDCRSVLIQYLINHTDPRTAHFVDVDTLFEHFLIDVSMGPGLETSRIKQAISTIHLYVQRCILGLEAANKVPNDKINRKVWEWMRSYQTWEANRKVFLYPENWLDPTLRDGKSEIFKDFEAKIMQTNLNMESLSQLTKGYVYALNELSDLKTQAYLWDAQTDEKRVFHLFARSRNTPYVYYYRRLTVTGWQYKSGSTTEIDPESRLLRWTPWQRLDMEIQTFEEDSEGQPLENPGTYLIPAVKNDRIFLFNPQILLKTKSKPNMEQKKISEMGNLPPDQSSPEKYWEIRMSWTELRNGEWSAKKVSQANIRVESLPAASIPGGLKEFKGDYNLWRFPSIDSFKFWVRTADNTGKIITTASGIQEMLVIDVETQFPISIEGVSFQTAAFTLGRFEMREYDILARNGTEVEGSWNANSNWLQGILFGGADLRPTMSTRFSQLLGNFSDAEHAKPAGGVHHLGKVSQPLLGEKKWKDDKVRRNNWVMSFDDTQVSRPTGLVLDVLVNDRGSQRYICLPDDDFANNKDAVTAIKTNNKMGPYLMKDATSIASINVLYETFSKSDEHDIDNGAAFGGSKDPVYHEQAAPYSIYNWEIGYHMASLVMERFLATQQLDLALEVARYIFDPTRPGGNTKACWRFPPFRDPSLVGKESPAQIVDKLDSKAGSNFAAAVLEWRENPFSPHVVARNYPKAYMKRTVRKYIEILIASGDQYFRQGTLESLPLAIQRYVEASHLFGERPKTFNSLSKSKPRTFSNLQKEFNKFNNSVVDLELDFPFKRLPKWRDPKADPAKATTSLMGILQTGYFCVPANPELVRLRDLIDDRLYKIRNCQDINGRAVKLRLFEPSLDPGALIQSQAAGLSISSFLADREAPMPKSRFQFLLSKALELCGELKAMGDEYLSIKEKRDSEALMALRQTQERSVTTMTLDLKKMQRDEALRTLESLEQTRHGHETRLSFYLQLAGENVKLPRQGQEWTEIVQDYDSVTKDELRMTATEKIESDRANEAAGFNQKASILETVAGVLMALPRATVNAAPIGCGVSIQWDASVAGSLLMTTAGVMKIYGQMKMNESERAARRAQLIRQLQERRFQANMAGSDIVVLDKQIAAQKIRVKLSESELRIQETQIEYSNELETWYRTKYTNEKLYAWMDNTFCKIYQDTYDLASTMARTAQKAFEFETTGPQRPKQPFLKSTGYWDRSRDGMFSARNLYLDLKRMEYEFLNNTYHDFEITKTVSLRQINAYQLLMLRYTRVAQFNLTEIMFDADFPGQYLRRLKSVAVSIPCIVGPYTSVNCTLTLTRNQIRVKEMAGGEDKPDDKIELPVNGLPITSIAVSHGRSDSGMFEMSFGGNNDRYGPFEGAGAISDWRLELPSPVPQFDYTTITDVIIHLRYTAKATPSTKSQQEASKRVREFMGEAGKAPSVPSSLFDLKNDFPDEWRRLTRPLVNGSTENPDQIDFRLKGILQRLPFWTKGRKVTAKTTTLVVSTEDGSCPQITLNEGITFSPKESGNEGSAKTLVTPSPILITDDWVLRIGKQEAKGKLNGLFMVLHYTVSGLETLG